MIIMYMHVEKAKQYTLNLRAYVVAKNYKTKTYYEYQTEKSRRTVFNTTIEQKTVQLNR